MDKQQFFISINGQRVEVTREVYLVYYRSKRRERYYEHDIKIERAIYDEHGDIVDYTPAKEDSLDRLMEAGEDFPDEADSVEDTAIRNVMAADLHKALDELPEPDRKLIDVLFFQGMTERQAAEIFGLSQKGINKRKAKILAKLKDFFEK